MKRIQSYSSISLYKKCPRAWEWSYVHGHRGSKSAAADRGTEIHDQIEQFFRGGPYPSAVKTLAPWRSFMENILRFEPSPEAEWAVLSDWAPCAYDDPNAFMRGKADLAYTDSDGVRHILDWKTGRQYPEHVDQGRAYVALDPEIHERYVTQFVYIDLPVQIIRHKYTGHDKVHIAERLVNTIIAIGEDAVYEPTPSPNACRYCELSFKKGGNCTRAS